MPISKHAAVRYGCLHPYNHRHVKSGFWPSSTQYQQYEQTCRQFESQIPHTGNLKCHLHYPYHEWEIQGHGECLGTTSKLCHIAWYIEGGFHIGVNRSLYDHIPPDYKDTGFERDWKHIGTQPLKNSTPPNAPADNRKKRLCRKHMAGSHLGTKLGSGRSRLHTDGNHYGLEIPACQEPQLAFQLSSFVCPQNSTPAGYFPPHTESPTDEGQRDGNSFLPGQYTCSAADQIQQGNIVYDDEWRALWATYHDGQTFAPSGDGLVAPVPVYVNLCREIQTSTSIGC